ncbi:glutaminase A [Natranaerobius thermophilus]|uniref:Glutaminase n=1 Tax=Natranaerobius thermophilus (strain ATCC BAA-1301 / DSM 18059 / JW/NM-WN-LF) TaxID=457570 RepID=GLSA_NATTJ|nr:glutaminase A [Natranaerobius thermophilus]B2A4X5.1 RecName: Full=Glutaminase [Natranaerobius thermophilus JW/NM-WN-LF]ACB83897.1 L-glutaminase [Natranaerobius thermophilus JW/NM-WN-LF]
MINNVNQEILRAFVENNRPLAHDGRLPTYIPALMNANKQDFGIHITELDGNSHYYGSFQIPFTVQSISKIITLAMAIMDNGEELVFSRVGMEPTEDKFNSILPLEMSSAYPPNPMINAGAIVVTSLIKGRTAGEQFERILDFTRALADNKNIQVDENAFLSERETGNMNRSLAYYLKDANVINGNVEEILETYFRHCSILVTAEDLSRIAYIFANDGKDIEGKQLIPAKVCKIVRAIMAMSGFYDESGEFAVRVGIPAKSGVGGGIIGVVPGYMGIGLYGPALNNKGTSIVGFNVLEELTSYLQVGIY